MEEVNLSSQDFQILYRNLAILKDSCSDADLRGGIIRQRTTDITMTFEVDLRPLIGEVDIPFSNLRQKLELMKCFLGNDVSLEVDTSYFRFRDTYSSFYIEKADLDYLDNKFITEDELNQIYVIDEDQLILSTEISQMICDRINTVSQVYNVPMIQVIFTGDEVEFSSQTHAKDQLAKFLTGLTTERELETTTAMYLIPFQIDPDNGYEVRMYQNDNCITKFSTTLDSINVNLYSRTRFANPNEAE